MTGFRGRTEQLDPATVKTRVEWNGAQVTTHDAFSLLAGEATFRGVYWLHVRLDSRPKYQRHDPYKKL